MYSAHHCTSIQLVLKIVTIKKPTPTSPAPTHVSLSLSRSRTALDDIIATLNLIVTLSQTVPMHPNTISRTPSRTITVVSLWTCQAFATLRTCRTFILLRPYRNFTEVVPLTFVFHDFDIQTKTKIAFFTRRFCAFLIYVGYLNIDFHSPVTA